MFPRYLEDRMPHHRHTTLSRRCTMGKVGPSGDVSWTEVVAFAVGTYREHSTSSHERQLRLIGPGQAASGPSEQMNTKICEQATGLEKRVISSPAKGDCYAREAGDAGYELLVRESLHIQNPKSRTRSGSPAFREVTPAVLT